MTGRCHSNHQLERDKFSSDKHCRLTAANLRAKNPFGGRALRLNNLVAGCFPFTFLWPMISLNGEPREAQTSGIDVAEIVRFEGTELERGETLVFTL